jgi:adenine-specific DNA-methyltransferase
MISAHQFPESHALVFPAALQGFPTTRYRGSKRKLIPWIYEHLREIPFDSAADLFGGSAVVSYLFKKMGKRVFYNDLLRFNYHIGRAIIQNDHVVVSPHELETLLSATKLRNSGFITDTFEGFYFTVSENIWLDTVLQALPEWSSKLSHGSTKRSLVLYSLAQTCLSKRPFNLFHRKNLYLREAIIPRKFGNKNTWDKPIETVFRAFLHEANGLVFQGAQQCLASNQDALALSDVHYDLIYIDPPYIAPNRKTESSDYRRVYHFLEGMCQYSAWKSMVNVDDSIRSLNVTADNAWLNAGTITKSLDALFESLASSIIVMSYKKLGVPGIETIIRYLKKHGRKVTTHSKHYKYALNHQNGDAIKNREVLIIAR